MAKSVLTDADFLRDPADRLAELRAQGPLHATRVPLIGALTLTTTDAAARELLKDESRFARNAGGHEIGRRFWWLPPFMRPLLRNMILMDGAEHRRLRAPVEAAFSRAAIDDLRPAIARLADALLDGLPSDRPVDITAHYTRKLPLLVICALLGLPAEDHARLTRWIAPLSGPTGLVSFLRALPGLRRTLRYLRADFAEVRTTGRPGLIRDLLAEAETAQLTEDEVLSLVFTLFIAGHETTVHLLNDAILSLMTDPKARADFTSGKVPVSRAVEEFLRHWSPVMMTKPMVTTRDTEIEGAPITKGTQISAFLLAANHDPARFENPEALDLDRKPNAHLGFGFGPHVCLGMQLARAEAQIALERLLTRFPEARLVDAPAMIRRTGMRGPVAVTLRLAP